MRPSRGDRPGLRGEPLVEQVLRSLPVSATATIFSRRSVRTYTTRMVDERTVHALLRAAVRAPSSMNRQPWLFAVVQDASCLQRYSDRARGMVLPATFEHVEGAREPTQNLFYGASTLVVIGVAERDEFTDADCWLAAANLMLSATEVGLGTCPVGVALPFLNTAEGKSELGLPPSGLAVAPIVLGYPASMPPPVPRAEPKVVSWLR